MHLIRFSAVACLLAALIGCGASESSPIDLNTDVLSQLPDGDREIALSQWSCVVCKELLAKDGAPLKSEKIGSPVFCCTEDCLTQFEKSPQKFSSVLTQ